jgi:hypothetical protein
MIYDPKSERTLSVSQTKKWVITSVQSRVQLISGTDKMNLWRKHIKVKGEFKVYSERKMTQRGQEMWIKIVTVM